MKIRMAVLAALVLLSSAALALAGSGTKVGPGGYTLDGQEGTWSGTGVMNPTQSGGGQNGQASMTPGLGQPPWGTGTFQLVWIAGAGEYWAFDVNTGAYVGEMDVTGFFPLPPPGVYTVQYYDTSGNPIGPGTWSKV